MLATVASQGVSTASAMTVVTVEIAAVAFMWAKAEFPEVSIACGMTGTTAATEIATEALYRTRATICMTAGAVPIIGGRQRGLGPAGTKHGATHTAMRGNGASTIMTPTEVGNAAAFGMQRPALGTNGAAGLGHFQSVDAATMAIAPMTAIQTAMDAALRIAGLIAAANGFAGNAQPSHFMGVQISMAE
jgi:hypothetical protein